MTESAAQAFAAAFVKALASMPDVHKDKTAQIETKSGGKFSYSYADLASIIALVRPVLAKHGLAYAQATDTLADGTVSVTTRIYHEGGHVESFGTLSLNAGTDARQAGGAVTYARRYSLCAALGIAPDEDTDGAGVGTTAQAATRSNGQAKVTKEQHAKIGVLVKSLGELEPHTDWVDYSRSWAMENYGKSSRADLLKNEAHVLIEHLSQLETERKAA